MKSKPVGASICIGHYYQKVGRRILISLVNGGYCEGERTRYDYSTRVVVNALAIQQIQTNRFPFMYSVTKEFAGEM
jgi:hypothetical protein